MNQQEYQESSQFWNFCVQKIQQTVLKFTHNSVSSISFSNLLSLFGSRIFPPTDSSTLPTLLRVQGLPRRFKGLSLTLKKVAGQKLTEGKCTPQNSQIFTVRSENGCLQDDGFLFGKAWSLRIFRGKLRILGRVIPWLHVIEFYCRQNLPKFW